MPPKIQHANLNMAALLQLAISHHQLGRLAEAAPLYAQILQRQPMHADANHNLGSLRQEQGALAEALTFYKAACDAQPANAVYAESYADALLAATCEQFPILFKAAQYAECEASARKVVEQYPQCGVAWKYLGAALLVSGKPSIAILETAARLLPLDPSAWSNLGAAFHQIGQSDAGLQHCLHALKLNATFLEAHLNLGLIYQGLGQFAAAAASYQAVLQLDPSLVIAMNALSILLKEQGEFAQSREHAQRAVAQLLAQWRSAQLPANALLSAPVGVQQPMCVARAHIALVALRQRLDAAGIPWCLYAGSCLGVFRDGDLLPYDKDIDIALPATVSRQEIIDLLTYDGCFKLLAQAGLNKAVDNKYAMAFSHVAQNIGIDFFFLHVDGAEHFITGFEHAGRDVKCLIRRFDFQAHPWINGDHTHCPLPANPERYFEDVYGANWRSPDPYYDTVLSNPSRMTESFPVVLCYGYCRLVEKLLRQNWPAARAYCAQILVKVDDPVIAELALFLDAHKAEK